MARIKFGGFVAPHHPIGENPTLLLQRDLELAEHLDRLGYDEFWCGEHHSTGWEMIASPEIFLAAAGERTHRIMLGTGVISLPYHHPFNVAQRLVQLDHMTRGRIIFGSGPGALPSDAYTLGIDPMLQRDRQDEAMGVIRKLLRGEDRFQHESDWFTLKDARLQLLPLQENMPFAVASMISPSGMTLAGKHETGVLSIGSMSTAGLQALPNQWAFAEESAAKHGNQVKRDDWRVVMSWHIAETKKQAQEEAKQGLFRWHNEYTVGTLMRPGAVAYDSADAAIEDADMEGGGAIIGTPDDLIKAIRDMVKLTGGFGTVIGFAHDWANREATLRSWDLIARYVIPEVNGMLEGFRESQRYVIEHREVFDRAGAAVMAKIMENEKAAGLLSEQSQGKAAMPAHHAPDLSKHSGGGGN
ncbi:MAG: LLM class flavin-dependent oxidoreductase [Gammaproteobacteria bacterium]|nr:LLM class flavin-dependent oxidoreductase [Gammaproteobacteria bacterium]